MKPANKNTQSDLLKKTKNTRKKWSTMSSRTKIPFLIGSLTTFLLKRHIQRSDWLPSSIWSAFTTARCCLGLISAAKMAQITSIYRISILTTTSARFHVTSLPFFFNFAPGSVPPRAAGSCARPGSSKSPIFIYFFYQNFPTSLKNPLPRFSFRIFQPFPIILFETHGPPTHTPTLFRKLVEYVFDWFPRRLTANDFNH